jgi:hypothetical protein
MVVILYGEANENRQSTPYSVQYAQLCARWAISVRFAQPWVLAQRLYCCIAVGCIANRHVPRHTRPPEQPGLLITSERPLLFPCLLPVGSVRGHFTYPCPTADETSAKSQSEGTPLSNLKRVFAIPTNRQRKPRNFVTLTISSRRISPHFQEVSAIR